MHTTARQVIEQAMSLADLPLIVQTLQDRYADEARRREQFFHDITEDMKAEFINGEVIVLSPVLVKHLDIVHRLSRLLGVFIDVHHLGRLAAEKCFCSFSRNDYEPDIVFFGQEKNAQITLEDRRLPPPDFIVEVLSPSTERNDRGVKFVDYESHGVGEYWIVDPEVRTIEQYVLRNVKYDLQRHDPSGVITSVMITGLCMPIAACFDDATNLQVLQQIIRAQGN